ncbi:hypothetical protein HY500_01690 [Candidatus Woesearchaeota archaeon]|nr:hypothetical protein [Candidatus Woesearchaeota archaeon]
MKEELRDKILYIPVILLSIYLVFRLVDTSALITNFPLDYSNDLSAHLARLHFLSEYGYHNLVPNWYNGFEYILFQTYPPGYYFAALPLYKLLDNVQLTAYISLILIYLLGFLAVFFIFKKDMQSSIKRMAFYLFFFVNPVSIGYLLRLGKLPELTGWLLNIIIFGIILYYKDKVLDKKFLFFIPSYSALLLSNVSSFIVMSPLILGFILIKKNKEQIYTILSVAAALIISSFWWIPFYLNSLNKSLSSEAVYTRWLTENAPNSFFTFTTDKVAAVLSSLTLIILFYLYWKSKNESRNELILFLPMAITALLIFITPFTSAITFIPIINRPPVDTFTIGFLLIAIYFFLKIEYSPKQIKIIKYVLPVLIIISIILSFTMTSFYPRLKSIDKETISLLPHIKGNFIVLENNKEKYNSSYSRGYYSYAPIYYDATTISGWEDQILTGEDAKEINEFLGCYKKNVVQCKNSPLTPQQIIEKAKALNVGSIIMYDEDCGQMKVLLNPAKETEHVCLFQI